MSGGERVWFDRAKDVPERWFPQNELSQDSMAFDMLFGHEDRVRHQKASADAWFDSRGAERYDIIEDAMRISDNQVLCLLWLENDEMLEDVAHPRTYR